MCVSSSSGCGAGIFQPRWADKTDNTTGTTGRVYQGYQCKKNCEGLAWWAWLLISVAILLSVLGIALIIYRCCNSNTTNKTANAKAADVEQA
ncbi:unnamed protein product [Closterium sp. NIES-53]